MALATTKTGSDDWQHPSPAFTYPNRPNLLIDVVIFLGSLMEDIHSVHGRVCLVRRHHETITFGSVRSGARQEDNVNVSRV